MSDMHHDHKEHQDAVTEPGKILYNSGYWKTLDQWNAQNEQNPELLKELAETEFKSSPLRDGSLTEADQDSGFARRDFLKLMGASLAMASAGCIRRPVQKIIPYNKAVEEVTFGVPNYYTSASFDGMESLGLLVKTREGRPIKIDGNPEHPLNRGASSARAQAFVLSVYDPDRLKGPKKNLLNKEKANRDTIGITWENADKEVVAALQKSMGATVLLTGGIASPSYKAAINEFCAGFKAKHVSWEPLHTEDVREGQKAAYGEDSAPFYKFDKAKVIVSIDADFLGTWISPTAFNRDFSAGRRDPSGMSKLIVFDSGYSLAGANADMRVQIKPSQQVTVAMALAHALVVKKGYSKFAGNGAVKAALEPFAGTAAGFGLTEAALEQMADDLWKNKGQSLIVAGGLQTQTAHAKELQIAVSFLNSALENDGTTVLPQAGFTAKASARAMTELIADMKAGKVKTLIITGVNPGYALASEAGFAEAVKSVGTVVYTGDRMDETALYANYVLPDNHALESWGDVEAVEGVYSIQQPTIRPMYDTREVQMSLINWAKAAKVAGKRSNAAETYYDFVRGIWKDEVQSKVGHSAGFENFWEEALQKGVVSSGRLAKSSAARSFKTDALSTVKKTDVSGMELVLYPTVALGDGTFANVSWLQELPDPVTKICWDNYACVSLKTADGLHLKEGDIVKLTVSGKTLDLPVHIQPGLHNEVIAVAVGYGRTAAGKVGTGVGSNAYTLMKVDGGTVVASGQTVTLEKTGARTRLACVAGNNSMEGRKIVAETTLQDYLKDKHSNNHRPESFSLWSGHAYNGKKWGMAVDLNTCTGCSACMIACQAENNIPVVGKKYVLEGREMHWIRIDRYFTGDPANAGTVFQPVMCQQCDNAPCETVCPVLATVHNSEGLNDMAYNRCVGTRYCSNNCPYKVRRFNWFNFTGKVEQPLNQQYNPDVTVRMRGVMEKCSFCVHRIKYARNQARLDNREMKEGDVKTACEQACPSSAIIFGDINDKNSAVGKIFREEPRAYGLIEEFNAAPVVRYLTKIRNTDKLKEGGHV
jgi:molybdopterin-containing oxidoreductase family iron-sulfur binding subunit